MKSTALDGVHDAHSRAVITHAAEQIARMLLERKLWRTRWAVEIEGCVFNIAVNGYAKKKSPHWRAPFNNEEDAAELMDNGNNTGGKSYR